MRKKAYIKPPYEMRGKLTPVEDFSEWWRHSWGMLPGDQTLSDHFRERPVEAIVFEAMALSAKARTVLNIQAYRSYFETSAEDVTLANDIINVLEYALQLNTV